jgi:hypothetical protein
MYADIFGTIPIAEALFSKGALLARCYAFMMAVTTLFAALHDQPVKRSTELLALFSAICTVASSERVFIQSLHSR